MSLRTSRRAAAALLGIAGAAGSAHAQIQPSTDLVTGQITTASYITTADNSNPNGVAVGAPATNSGNPTGYNDPALGFNNPRYWAKAPQYSGVTQLIMTYDTQNTTTGATGTAAFICSGALINNGYSVLTAGHCLHNFTQTAANGQVTQLTLKNVQVRLGQNFGGNTTAEPGAGAPNVNQAFNFVQDVTPTAQSVMINPGYTGSVIDQHDIAVLNLGTSAPHIYQSYDLYTQSAIGETYNITGWGGRGNGDLGTFAGGAAGARIRQGLNTFDVSYADPHWSADFMNLLFGSRGPQDVYVSDFDNTALSSSNVLTNNPLCILTGLATIGGQPIWTGAAPLCDTGLGIDEVSSAGGDSGGPSFIDGRIAAVTSFGETFGRGFGDIDGALNSSFGELNGMTRVDINADWVDSATTTPEPTTIVLLGGGLLAIGAAARRRRQS